MLAIISDIHDNLANLEKFLKYAKENKISEIFCLGDLTGDTAVKELADGFDGKIYLVCGNADFFDEDYVKNFPKIKYFGRVGNAEAGGKKIAFTHLPGDGKKLSESKKYDYVFYGHTHKPWQEEFNGIILLNPGTIAGTFSKPSFAVWDEKEDKFSLILLDLLR
ncbi:MAG: YfcE family phosphodiesterase [bacterium]